MQKHTKEPRCIKEFQQYGQATKIVYHVKHSATLLVTLIVGIVNHNVYCILINSGNSINILSKATYDQIGPLSNWLRP